MAAGVLPEHSVWLEAMALVKEQRLRPEQGPVEQSLLEPNVVDEPLLFSALVVMISPVPIRSALPPLLKLPLTYTMPPMVNVPELFPLVRPPLIMSVPPVSIRIVTLLPMSVLPRISVAPALTYKL